MSSNCPKPSFKGNFRVRPYFTGYICRVSSTEIVSNANEGTSDQGYRAECLVVGLLTLEI